MKKLRLISFMLAFVMVVAMMVPALAVLVAAEGNATTLPAGDTLNAWGMAFNGASPVTGQETTGEIANPNKDAAWAGLEFGVIPVEGEVIDTMAGAKKSWKYVPEVVEGDKLLGVMFDLSNINANHNNAFYVAIVVDGVSYFSMQFEGDGAISYLNANDTDTWVAVSNKDLEFTGADDGLYERATRFPKAFAGKLFIPVENFYASWDVYYSGAKVLADAPALTNEILAAATSIEVYASTVWVEAAYGSFGEEMGLVYNPAEVVIPEKPVTPPDTLPTADTLEWTTHPGYSEGAATYAPYSLTLPQVFVGAEYALSDNLLGEDVIVCDPADTTTGTLLAGTEGYIRKEITPVPADSNLAGIMVRVALAGTDATQANNGFEFGFESNGVKYTGAIGTDGALGARYTYIYDEDLFGTSWVAYRDATSHTAARLPQGFDGFVFISIDHITAAANQTAEYIFRQTGTEAGDYDVVADLTTAGISLLDIGQAWGTNAVTVSGVHYVYTEGTIATETDRLPAGDLMGWAIAYPGGSATPSQEAIALIPNATAGADWAGWLYETSPIAEATKLDAPAHAKFVSTFTYDLTAVDARNLAGIMLDVTTTAKNGNNGTVVALEVDGVMYYNIAFQSKVNTYLLENGTGEWLALSNTQLAFTGTETVERAVRIPGSFEGKMFIPVESFTVAYAGEGLAGYNGAKAEVETALTADVLANATSIKLYANTSWDEGTTTFGAAELVYTALPAGLDTLPDLDIDEWVGHPGYLASSLQEYITHIPLDGRLAGAAYDLSTNLLGVTLDTADALASEDGEHRWISTTLDTAAKAEANIAGIMLRVTLAEAAGDNNCLALGFVANGTKYAVSSNYGDTYYVENAAYLFNLAGADDWVWYRDKAANSATRLPAGFDGYVFFSVDSIKTVADQEAAKCTRNPVLQGYGNLFTDLIEGGITEIEVGKSYGANLAVTELSYVYVEGFDGKNVTTLPGEYVTGWNIGWLNGNPQTSRESTMTMLNPANYANIKDMTFTTTSIGAGETIDPPSTATVGVQKYALDTDLATETLVGVMIDVSNVNAGTCNNSLVFSIEVDGVAYYSLSFDGDSAYAYYTWNNSSKWYALASTNFSFTSMEGRTERGLRTPPKFAGKVFIPISAFETAYSAGEGFDKYNVSQVTTDAKTLTVSDIKNAQSVTLYAGAVYNESSFGEASLVYADAVITGASVSIGSNISMNVGAIVNGEHESVQMMFVQGDVTAEDFDILSATTIVDGVKGEDGKYSFTLENINAMNMMDNIAMALMVDGNVLTSVDEYSLATYATNVLRTTDDDNVKAALVDLLYYGEALQVIADYNTDNLPTTLLTVDEMDLRSISRIGRERAQITLDAGISTNAQWKSVALVETENGFALAISAVVLDTTGVSISLTKNEVATVIASENWGAIANQDVVLYNVSLADFAGVVTANFVKDAANDGATMTFSVNAVLAALYKAEGATDAEKEVYASLHALAASLAKLN